MAIEIIKLKNITSFSIDKVHCCHTMKERRQNDNICIYESRRY